MCRFMRTGFSGKEDMNSTCATTIDRYFIQRFFHLPVWWVDTYFCLSVYHPKTFYCSNLFFALSVSLHPTPTAEKNSTMDIYSRICLSQMCWGKTFFKLSVIRFNGWILISWASVCVGFRCFGHTCSFYSLLPFSLCHCLHVCMFVCACKIDRLLEVCFCVSVF